jgi:hypothetical protein
MKKTISQSDFIHEFDNMNRGDNFSYEGRVTLYDYLTEMEEGSGTEIELDVIDLCIGFTEWLNIQEFQNYHGEDYETIEDIEQVTMFIPIDDESFITSKF